MPFFEDIGVKTDETRGPLRSTFALIADQIERIVALNLGWSLQLFPALAALAFDVLPLWLRVAMLSYSVVALGPATGILYVMIARAARGEMLRFDETRSAIRQYSLASLLRLMPLYSLFAWISLLDQILPVIRLGGLQALCRLALMLLAVLSIHWGPIFGNDPRQSPGKILAESARLFWKRPGSALGIGLVIVLLWVLGLLSIGGLFLIVPAAVAMLQTRLYFHLTRKESVPA
jgi:hypothetical protein